MSIIKKDYSYRAFRADSTKQKYLTEGNVYSVSEKEEDFIVQKQNLKQILSNIKTIQVSFLCDTNSEKNVKKKIKNLL